MLVFRSNPLSLLHSHFILLWFFCFFFISSTLFTFSDEASQLQPTHISDGREISNGVDTRRIIAEINLSNTAESSHNSSMKLILASERTHRRDPANGMKYYNGGWNISDPHYLYSVGFSAAPPILVGAIWFVLFGLWLLIMIIRYCCCCCCCRKSRREPRIDHNRKAYCISLSLLLLFTIAAVGGGVFTYVGEEKLERNIIKLTCFILEQADMVFSHLGTLFNTLLEAKKIGVQQLTLPADIQSQIDEIGGKINYYSDKIHSVSKNSTQNIRNVTEPIRRRALIVVAAALLALILLGLLISLCGWKFLIYCLVIIGWIVVTVTFVLAGVFLLIHNVVEDSCVAVDQWLQNPNADSALEDIIPRVDNETSQKIYSTSRGVTYQVVQVINGAITNVTNANIPPNAGPIYYNQSGPLMPLLCNPLNPNLSDRQCAPGEVAFDNTSQVWSKFTCQVSGSGICQTPGRLTPSGYTNIVATANVSSILYEEGPFLMELVDSTFIKNLFASIRSDNCPGLSKYSKMTYAGLLTASIGLLLSVLLWIVLGKYARKPRQ